MLPLCGRQCHMQDDELVFVYLHFSFESGTLKTSFHVENTISHICPPQVPLLYLYADLLFMKYKCNGYTDHFTLHNNQSNVRY